LFVSDDGQSLAVGYEGMNLVPRDVDLSLVVMRFHRQGQLVRTLRLADLYESRAQLADTASHRAWVRGVRVNRENQLALELVTGPSVAFSMRTGQAQKRVRDGG